MTLLHPLICVVLLLATAVEGAAETMSGALARAYMGNPDLNQQRAGVRATDETLPQASAAWRPTAIGTAQFGYNFLDFRTSGGVAPVAGAASSSPGLHVRKGSDPGTLGLTVTQNIFN
ncbi:MAG TPA: TolC family protein, partial [Methylocella sp.]|nr:TolC family protein [Methylocella sp.]